MTEIFGEVQRHASSSEWRACFESCGNVIAQYPEHLLIAQKCQLFCLFKLGDFEQALELLKNMKYDDVRFEAAYTLYKLQRYEEAIKYVGDETICDRLLKAQLCYQLEDLPSSMKLYESLLRDKDFEANPDVNMIAIESCLKFKNLNYKANRLINVNCDDVEALYNYGCLQLNGNSVEDAIKTLRLCEEKMNESKNPHVLEARHQLAAALQQVGKLNEANELYKSIVHLCSDSILATLSNMNCLLVNTNNLPIEKLHKRMKKLSTAVDKELNETQRLCLQYNEKFFSVQTGQCNSLEPFESENITKLTECWNYLRLTMFVKRKEYRKVLELLKREHFSDSIVLRAKALAFNGSFLEAGRLLEEVGDLNLAPVICDLYLKSHAIDKLKAYIWKLLNKGNQSAKVITRISKIITRVPEIKDDSSLLTTIRSSMQLPTLTDLFGDMSLENIENSLQCIGSSDKKRHGGIVTSVQLKRKKKNKIPKSLDKPIDPERWIPLKERSYYKHGRRRIKHTGKKTIQGVVETTESEQWLGERTAIASKHEAELPTKKPSIIQNKALRSKRKKRDKW